LGNLLDNAGKWSAECVELSLEQRNGLIKIIVTDDGSGVPKGDQVHLGQRGRRLDEQTPGHGLGLAIVRDIVERYSGHVSFSSGSKRGLRVLVEIAI
jgi:signal transduction histidine kinase